MLNLFRRLTMLQERSRKLYSLRELRKWKDECLKLEDEHRLWFKIKRSKWIYSLNMNPEDYIHHI